MINLVEIIPAFGASQQDIGELVIRAFRMVPERFKKTVVVEIRESAMIGGTMIRFSYNTKPAGAA